MPPNPNFCFTQVPFAMGTAGLLLGLAALAVLTTASACGALMLLEIYLAHPWAQNLPELGEAAMVCLRAFLFFLGGGERYACSALL